MITYRNLLITLLALLWLFTTTIYVWAIGGLSLILRIPTLGYSTKYWSKGLDSLCRALNCLDTRQAELSCTGADKR